MKRLFLVVTALVLLVSAKPIDFVSVKDKGIIDSLKNYSITIMPIGKSKEKISYQVFIYAEGYDKTKKTVGPIEFAKLFELEGKVSMISVHTSSLLPKSLLGLAKLRSLSHLDVSGSRFNDDCLVVLESMPNLELVDVNGTDVSGDLVKVLERCPKIRHVSAENTKVTNESLRYCSKMRNLEVLVLNRTDISDAGINTLIECNLPGLKNLEINYTKVTKLGVEKLINETKIELVSIVGLKIDNIREFAKNLEMKYSKVGRYIQVIYFEEDVKPMVK